MKIAIVGGGISGLAAAYDLQKSDHVDVTLFEKGARVGGKLQTAHEAGLLIERGPDSIFSVKPWATDLMCELGMESELIEPLSSQFSILTKGKLHAVPRELASLMPAASGALESAAFLSPRAKRRALQESEVRRGGGGDESVASFFRRRFGRTFSELVAEPLLAGTHAGDPEKLSMAALYPSYLAMERDHGSIANAVAARATALGAARKAGFVTLRDGMGSFPTRLAEALTRIDVKTSAEISAITMTPGGRLHIETPLGAEEFDHLILAVPAHIAACIVAELAPEAARGLGAIRFVSTAIVSLLYPRSAFPRPLHGNGFLVPRREASTITGSTWSSNKWPGRAPDDRLLLRVFMGRDGAPDIDLSSDKELVLQATKAIAGLLHADGQPTFSRLDRWSKGLPQYELGHLERLAKIEEGLQGLPISLVGSSYRGNSIPDCVRQGREAASAYLKTV